MNQLIPSAAVAAVLTQRIKDEIGQMITLPMVEGFPFPQQIIQESIRLYFDECSVKCDSANVKGELTITVYFDFPEK